MPDKPKEEGARRVAGVIVTHGQVANELLSAAETIIGQFKHITAVSIGWHDDVEAAKNEIRRAVERVSEGGGVLLMTDMFGGTPTNIASMFFQPGEVEVVTGVNLPMVIKLASQQAGPALEEVARLVRDQGRQGIYLAGELLASGGGRKG
ncbi:MAG: mannose system component [Acidobacteriota bacterium]|jgi:PTS system mannose-specific IIA component|nr:mannose system component [Acidobacteriota bacterium]MDT7808742.1 mannose system component [Acidobacteriota bacterium]